MNFLKTKFIVICLILLLVSIGVMGFSVYLFRGQENLFFIIPSVLSSPSLSIELLEEISEKETLLTYEILSIERLSASQRSASFTLIETNSNYLHILGCNMISGSFFTRQAWDEKLRYAVLNENAAISIFGSINITGSLFSLWNETWIITGVIDDRITDESRIYIPSSINSKAVSAFVLMEIDHITSTLRPYRIREEDFHVISLASLRRLLMERLQLIFLVFFILLILSFYLRIPKILKIYINTLKIKLSSYYFREFLYKERMYAIKSFVLILSVIILPILTLIISLPIVSILLSWHDIPNLSLIKGDLYFFQLILVRNLEIINRIFFIFSLLLILVIVIKTNYNLPSTKKVPEGEQ